MKTWVLSFVAAALFAVAAVITLIEGSVLRGAIGIAGAISFLLAGIHWRRKAGR